MTPNKTTDPFGLRRPGAALDRERPHPLRDHSAQPSSLTSKIIVHVDLIRLKTVNRLHHRRLSLPLKPSRTAPAILIRDRNQTVLHRVLMHIVQTRKITLFVTQPRLPKVVPHFSSRTIVKTIDPVRRPAVKVIQKLTQAFSSISRRVSNKMIVIRKHSPSLQIPSIPSRVFQKTALQRLQSLISRENMLFLVCASRHDIRSRLAQTMKRRMRPIAITHNHTLPKNATETQALLECGDLAPLWIIRSKTLEASLTRHNSPSFHSIQSAARSAHSKG